jgi:hypothetical protein
MPDQIIILTGEHAMIMPHMPKDQYLDLVAKKALMEAKDTHSFGLFDTAQPNFSTYYPDVTENDLKPEEDKNSFIYPVYRALSEVIVHKRIHPIDFSVNGVLKNSMGKLKGQTVYPNHEMAIGNHLGVIFEEAWQDSYKSAEGKTIPGGINVRLKLDGKSNPNVARGIMMEPPAIHSTSVTVEFGWEKSHASMDDRDFFGKMGSYGEDGAMIRKVVTEVKRYHEISLVAHGADPFAKMLDKNGKLVNENYAASVYGLEENGKPKTVQHYVISYKEDLTSLSEVTTEHQHQQVEYNTENMKKELIALAAIFAIAVEGKTEEQVLTECQLAVQPLLSLKEANTALATEKANLSQQIADLTPKAAIGDKAVTTLREAVKISLNVLKENKPDAAMLALVDSASFETLEALRKDYETQLNEKAPLHCGDCNSENVSRRTSTIENTDPNKPIPTKPKTQAQLTQELREKHAAKLFITSKNEATK